MLLVYMGFIDAKLKRDNKTLIWLFAPGIIDGEKIDPGRVADITGIRMDIENIVAESGVKIVDQGDPVTSFVPKGGSYGMYGKTGPRFIPKEGKVLGVFSDGKPGLVIKKFPDWTSIYSFAAAVPSAALLRGMAKQAGVHVANTNDEDITYYSDKLLAIHTAKGGKRILSVRKQTTSIEELITGKKYNVRNNEFEVELEPVSTSIFLME